MSENPFMPRVLKVQLGTARMCRFVFDEMKRIEPEHPWQKAMKEFFVGYFGEAAVLDGEFSLQLDEECPPDRVVFYGNDGNVIETVWLPAWDS